LTPEQVIDEIYDIYGDMFEICPEEQHLSLLVSILTKMIMKKNEEIHYLYQCVKPQGVVNV